MWPKRNPVTGGLPWAAMALLSLAALFLLFFIYTIYNDYKITKCVSAKIEEIEDSHKKEIKERNRALELLEETNEKLNAENKWARAIVPKQAEAIEKLKEGANANVLQCLDVVIDPGFVP